MSEAPVPVIETRHLNKTYEESHVRAVDGVSFEIGAGEWVALTGPSGSGKSTLLHLLAALDEPTSGDILVNGRNLKSYGNLDHYRSHDVGLVFQLHNLLPNLSALQNVQIAMVGTGVGRRESATRAAGLLDSVGLAARTRLRPPELSGGERQRVAIARALANGPSILLADEPTGSLDAAAAESVMDLFTRIRSERRLTILLVTHDPLVAACADRIIHMRDGRLVDESEATSAARKVVPPRLRQHPPSAG
jgi:putative ABC transport system ATP-binding protein